MNEIVDYFPSSIEDAVEMALAWGMAPLGIACLRAAYEQVKTGEVRVMFAPYGAVLNGEQGGFSFYDEAIDKAYIKFTGKIVGLVVPVTEQELRDAAEGIAIITDLSDGTAFKTKGNN